MSFWFGYWPSFEKVEFVCAESFQYEKQLNQHKPIHLDEQPDDPKICFICYSVFDRAEELKEHKLIHLEETPHKCKSCDESFTFIRQLKDHMNEHDHCESEINNKILKIFFNPFFYLQMITAKNVICVI